MRVQLLHTEPTVSMPAVAEISKALAPGCGMEGDEILAVRQTVRSGPPGHPVCIRAAPAQQHQNHWTRIRRLSAGRIRYGILPHHSAVLKPMASHSPAASG